MTTKFRKKPVVIEAVQWTGDNRDEIIEFCSDLVDLKTKRDGCLVNVLVVPLDGYRNHRYSYITIETLEGRLSAQPDDWIIRGVQGEYYPCKPDIFAATYEPVDD